MPRFATNFENDNGTSGSGDNWESFGTTVAKDCGQYYLCEGLPKDNLCRIIYKKLAKSQVAFVRELIKAQEQQPKLAEQGNKRQNGRKGRRHPVNRGYPKHHSNIENNPLTVSGKLMEHPILPGAGEVYVDGNPGPVRAIFEKKNDGSGFDIIYHDPRKQNREDNLDFTMADEVEEDYNY